MRNCARWIIVWLSKPSSAACAAAITPNPRAIPTVRESMTCTGIGESFAAIRAASEVPDMDEEMCKLIISFAPFAASS